MEASNRWMFLIGLVLVMATCMTGNVLHHGRGNRFSKHLQDTDCITTTIRNEACHAGHCHNSTTYIHGCDTYDGESCDNLTVNYNVHNTTGWRNTTCLLYACYSSDSNECDNANLTFQSCTNGDCRNGITRIHGCLTSSSVAVTAVKNAFVLPAVDVEGSLGDFFDVPCVNLLFDAFRRTRLDNTR